jgi:putative transposase
MKKSIFNESQIVAILKEGEAGLSSVAQLRPKHGIGAATYHQCEVRCGGGVGAEAAA